MENKNISIAYHESARVVFAYLNGYSCDSMEVSGKESTTRSKLNAGNEAAFVQAVLSGNPASLPPENLQQGVTVARKLMPIYCAGTCADIYFQNDLTIPEELALDISGQDLSMIEKIQSFLKNALVDHSNDFPSQTIVSVYKKLKDPGVWKAIELLVKKSEQKTIVTRYDIVDSLMQAGIPIQKQSARSGYNVDVTEDNTKPAPSQSDSASFQPIDESPLDIVVKNFLKKIKSDWKEDELNAATEHLHKVYKKYG